jgi:hypothetical protein
LNVEDEEGWTWFSFLVSTFSFNAVISWLGDLTFNGSIVRISLESSRESSEDPNNWANGVLDSQWNSEALSDSEDQVSGVFDNKTNCSSGWDNNAVGISVVRLNSEDDLFGSWFWAWMIFNNDGEWSFSGWDTWKKTVFGASKGFGKSFKGEYWIIESSDSESGAIELILMGCGRVSRSKEQVWTDDCQKEAGYKKIFVHLIFIIK